MNFIISRTLNVCDALRSARHPKRREAKHSAIVAEYVDRKFDCKVKVSLPRCVFDLVAFNPLAEEFYVVKTKLGHKPADIGHAVGQVLAYEAVILLSGHEFMEKVFDKLGLPFAITSKFVNEETVKVHRYVALTDEACKNYELIEDLRKRLAYPVGIIRLHNGGCRDYLRVNGKKVSDVCESEPVQIGIMKRYDNGNEFLAKSAEGC